MKRQPIAAPLARSAQLSNFLSSMSKKKYDCHGHDECAKKYSAQQTYWQKFHLEKENSEILLDSTLCQPFLFWNEQGKIDIAGVKNYNPKTQTGSLEIPTKDGLLTAKNVHSYIVYAQINDKYLPTNSRYLPEYHELTDIYVAIITQESQSFILNIFHNCDLVFTMDNVFECGFYQHKETAKYINRKGYFRFAKKKSKHYKNYLYDINSETLFTLQDSNTTPSFYLPELVGDYRSIEHNNLWFHYKDMILHGSSMKVVLHLDESKASQVVSEYIKTAESYKILDNIFPDDPTVNIEVVYPCWSKELRFLAYCAEKDPTIFGHGIMGLSLDEIEVGTKNNLNEHHHVYDYSPYHIEQCIYINKDLYKRCHEKIRLNLLPNKIYQSCISSHNMCVYLSKYISHDYKDSKINVFKKEKFTEEAKLYDEIANSIAQSGKLNVKWKNEYALFKLVLTKYPDAIYQYHCHWLGHQSLDVFVPSAKIAFEYQGRQHYEAVSFFGGEERLQYQIERDNRKRQLCKENGITLYEWRYDEPISSIVLERKVT